MSLFLLNINNKDFTSIQLNNKSFYFVPKDKGGQNIPNQDKKGLHLSYYDDNDFRIIENKNIKYSIQIYSNNNYDLVNNKMINILKNKEKLYLANEFFIGTFDSGLGKEYFLLYKDFDTRIEANEYCDKYGYFIENCLIVNVQNLE